jgi:hypothetical protein
MKLLKLLTLALILPMIVFGQNRLKDKTQTTSIASDDFIYLDGTTNGVRAFDASANIKSLLGSATYSTARTNLGVPGLSDNNTLTGQQNIVQPIIRTPATITITEASPDTGTIDITKAYSQATIDEATTLTPSAAGTNSGPNITLDVVNSGGSAYTITVDTATDFTFTAAASATTTVLLRSNGSGWLLVGGGVTANDLATITPVAADLFGFWDVSGGVSGKATLTSIALVTNAPRITALTSSATPTFNTDTCDVVNITAIATAITSMTTNMTGTPADFQQLEFRIKDDGTARAITWGANFAAGPVALPTTTTVNKTLRVFFEYDAVITDWIVLSTQSDL